MNVDLDNVLYFMSARMIAADNVIKKNSGIAASDAKIMH